MLYYESDYTAAGLVEKVNKHGGEITIHTIQTITVRNEMGLPEVAFVAFFSVKHLSQTVYKGVPIKDLPLEKRNFIGNKAKEE